MIILWGCAGATMVTLAQIAVPRMRSTEASREQSPNPNHGLHMFAPRKYYV